MDGVGVVKVLLMNCGLCIATRMCSSFAASSVINEVNASVEDFLTGDLLTCVSSSCICNLLHTCYISYLSDWAFFVCW